MASRTSNTGKNAIMQVFATILTIFLGLVNRYFFNKILDENYLGLTSLFATILGVLSFADLGISNSFTYCLYRPIADNDEDYIRILLYYFKRIMTLVMAAILVITLIVMPFLRALAPGAEAIDDIHLYLYFVLSICEILAGYFCTYQVCYVAASQKEYKLIPFRMFFSIIISICKLIVLLFTHSYTYYILVGSVLTIFQQLTIRLYIQRKYPIVKSIKKGHLKEADKASIKRNTASALMLKFANISVNQTDALIISTVLKIGTLGRITNYITIKEYVFRLISQIQTSAYASMGNVIASEKKEYQLDVFFKYLMVTQLMVSFAGCMLTSVMSPFIVLLFGEKWQVDELSILMMVLSSVIVYHTYAANILPTAYGRYDIVAKYALVEGAVNLIVSIIAINVFGLVGVYIGTMVAEIVYFIIEPKEIFKKLFDSDIRFYNRSIKGIVQTVLVMIVIYVMKNKFYTNSWLNFTILTVTTLFLWGMSFFMLWHNDKYLHDVLLVGKRIVTKGIHRIRGKI